jgi:hypothetical protein
MTNHGEFADLLARQLTLTRSLWQSLESRGIREGAVLALDFFFDAPSFSSASKLSELLRADTDYEVTVTALEDSWAVSGHTQPTSVALAILEEWVAWMVAAGSRAGCAFDGWGTELP